MDTLVLQPTATAQWQSLINEAEQSCQTHLSEELQSYLVFLLMRYLKSSDLANSILALEYLDSLEMTGRLREEGLRDVGDKCLLYSGLFPEQAQRRHVGISYYVHLGTSAYSILGGSLVSLKAQIFQRLSYHFVSLMDILQTTRELTTQQPTLTPLQAIELWNDTGSRHALATLSRYTHAIPVRVSFHESLPHYQVSAKRALGRLN